MIEKEKTKKIFHKKKYNQVKIDYLCCSEIDVIRCSDSSSTPLNSTEATQEDPWTHFNNN